MVKLWANHWASSMSRGCQTMLSEVILSLLLESGLKTGNELHFVQPRNEPSWINRTKSMAPGRKWILFLVQEWCCWTTWSNQTKSVPCIEQQRMKCDNRYLTRHLNVTMHVLSCLKPANQMLEPTELHQNHLNTKIFGQFKSLSFSPENQMTISPSGMKHFAYQNRQLRLSLENLNQLSPLCWKVRLLFDTLYHILSVLKEMSFSFH